MRLNNFLNEAIKKFVVTIRDLEYLASKISGGLYKKEWERSVETLLDLWYEGDKKDVGSFLKMYSTAGQMVIASIEKKLGYKLPYYD